VKRDTEHRRLEKIAHHEAGHAVIMHHFGVEIDELSIKPNVDRMAGVKPKTGDTNPLSTNPDEIFARFERSVLSFLGGLAAEHIYNREPKNISPIGSQKDLENAKELLRAFNVEVSPQDLIDEFFNKVVGLLKENWGAVETLSQALIKKGTVTGEEAVKIIEESMERERR